MIVLNSEKHCYFDGNKELISVTTLLKKHGLSPDYSNVNDEVVKAKAEYGKVVHEELDKYVKTGEIGFTDEVERFIELANGEKIKPLKSEFIVHNDLVAGTVDLLAEQNDCLVIFDYKTTSTLHKESVRWQLSLYNYLADFKADKIGAIHFNNGKAKLVMLEFIPNEEIERLLECEKNGEIYTKNQLVINKSTEQRLLEIQRNLSELKAVKEQLEAEEENIKAMLLEECEKNGIDSFENDYFKIKYVAPTTKESLDSKALKSEMPEIYNKFVKKSNVKAYIKITLKEVKE